MWRAAVLAMSVCACTAATARRADVVAPIVRTSDLDEVPAATPPPAEAAVTDSATPATDPATPPQAQLAPDNPVVFGLLDGEMAVEEAWERWRAGATTTYAGVFEIAVLANRGRPQAMADELMVIALARAVELSGCDPERLGRIRLLAIAVRGADHPGELDVELARLADMGPAECAQPPR